jgi:hypothetical protein
MVAADKLAHFHAGIAVAALAYPFGLAPAVLATVFAAVAKEVWDVENDGVPDVLDALATMAGGAALVAWYQLI